MCTYNGEKYLQEQLDSIANQSRLPDELIVCDDNSSDQSLSIVERFSASVRFPVRIFKNEDNMGSTKNFEKAITLCEGDIIALSDQDDVWKSNKLEIIQRSFTNAPKVGLFFSDANVTDEYMTTYLCRLWECVDFNLLQRLRLKNGNGFEVFLHHSLVTGATMAFRSELRKYILPLSTHWVHDGWIAIIASAISKVTIVANPLIKYRQHTQQQIGIKRDGLIRKYVVSKTTMPEGYILLADQYYDVHQRLYLFREEYKLEKKISKIKDKIKHLSARANIIKNENRPIWLVLNELFSLRYFLYSKGLYSFMKDCRSILNERSSRYD